MAPLDWSLLQFPVATVDTAWPERELVPALNRLIGKSQRGGIILVAVDSHEEADWVLGRIRAHLLSVNIPCDECTCDLADPTLLWEEVFGRLDVAGQLPRRLDSGSPADSGRASLWSRLRRRHRRQRGLRAALLFGATRVPEWSVETHLPMLRSIGAGAETLVFLPLTRRAFSKLGTTSAIDEHVIVPSIRDASAERLRALTGTLLLRELHDSELPEPAEVSGWLQSAVERILEKPPQSRAGVEQRVRAEISALGGNGPMPRRDTQEAESQLEEPESLPSAVALSGRFASSLGRLKECDEAFQTVYGRRLHTAFQSFPDPFASADPWNWFVSLVTRLYILMADYPARSGLAVIATSFGWDAATQRVVTRPMGTLHETIEALRTMLQHGIDESDKINDWTDKPARTQQWYLRAVGVPAVSRGHGRVLASCLLEEWESLLTELHGFVHSAPDPSLGRAVEAVLSQAESRVSQIEIAYAMDEAVRSIEPTLSVDALCKKHSDAIRSKLKGCCFRGEALRDHIRAQCEVIVSEETLACPVTGKWLHDQGVPSGEEMGALIKTLAQRWQQESKPRNREAFLAAAKTLVEAHLGGHHP